jgi:hypothetical protein
MTAVASSADRSVSDPPRRRLRTGALPTCTTQLDARELTEPNRTERTMGRGYKPARGGRGGRGGSKSGLTREEREAKEREVR